MGDQESDQIRLLCNRLATSDVYNGGATFMAFLAAQFGEDIHARLLRSSAGTFDAAFANETKPYALPELFNRFREWLDRSIVVREIKLAA